MTDRYVVAYSVESMATRRRARGKTTGKAEDQELWIGFARAALSGFRAEHIEDSDELVDNMVTVATRAADEMLYEYLERFTKRRWDWAEPREDDEEEDEDEDDED